MNSIYDLDELAILKDKLRSWPGEMALTHEDLVNLIYCVGNCERLRSDGNPDGWGQSCSLKEEEK